MASRPSSTLEDPPQTPSLLEDNLEDGPNEDDDEVTKPVPELEVEEGNDLCWKEKYELAEKQLNRVRQQTGKVRELLNMKVYIKAIVF